jgi:hypothetical protein
MDIGKPERVINVEPLEAPVREVDPTDQPAVPPPPAPVEVPAVPARRAL